MKKEILLFGLFLSLLSCEKKVDKLIEPQDIKDRIVGDYTEKYSQNEVPYFRIEKISDSIYRKTNLSKNIVLDNERISQILGDTIILEETTTPYIKKKHYIDEEGDLVIISLKNRNHILNLKKTK